MPSFHDSITSNCRKFAVDIYAKNILKLFYNHEDNDKMFIGIDLPRRAHCLNTFLVYCKIQLENSERTTALYFTEAHTATLLHKER